MEPQGTIAFLGALPQEVSGLWRCLEGKRKVRGQGFVAYRGRLGIGEAVVVAMGVGRRAAEAISREVLASPPPSAVVCLGFGGGAAPGLRAGELVLCRRAWNSETSGKAALSHPGLLEAARRSAAALALPWREGEVLTLGRVAASAREKAEIGQDFTVVDMESFWVARTAAEAGLPFLAVRAVLDRAEEDLPDLNRFVESDGLLRVGKLALHFSLRPWHWPGLLRLGLRARCARRNLTAWALAFAREHVPKPIPGVQGKAPFSAPLHSGSVQGR